MGLRIFTAVFCMLIPLITLGIGLYFFKHAPVNININFGYRTHRSMKSDETWRFAHRHCGKTWMVLGLVLLVVSAVAGVFMFRVCETNFIRLVAGLCLVQVVSLIASVFTTEWALKKHFDKDGNRLE